MMSLQEEEIDPSKHLRLISRVIGQMGLRGDVAEEAFSESLVTIVEAARSYDPSKGVPVANWLARNIRWGIQNWLAAQRREDTHKAPEALNVVVSKQLMEAAGSVEGEGVIFRSETQEFVENLALGFDSQVELNELLALCDKILTMQERQIILAEAIGYNGKEIARALKISESWVTKTKQRAQKKLKESS